MKHDLIHIQGKPYVLVPMREYRMMANGHGPAADLPGELLDSLYAGAESPVKLLRRHRGLTQEDLADAAGLSRPYITEIETGSKDGSVSAMRAIARALNVPAGLLLS